MFGTARQFMDLDWSPYLETTGANFNEGGEFQMANPDPWGLGPSGDVADRSFKMHNMASVWNGSEKENPVDRSLIIHKQAHYMNSK